MNLSLKYSITGYILIAISVIPIILGIYVFTYIGHQGNLWFVPIFMGLLLLGGGVKMIGQSSVIVDTPPPPESLQGIANNDIKNSLNNLSNKLSLTGMKHFVVEDKSAHVAQGITSGILSMGRVYAIPVYSPVSSDYVVMDKDKNILFTFRHTSDINSSSISYRYSEDTPYNMGKPLVYIVDKEDNVVGEILRLHTVDYNNKAIIIDTLVNSDKIPLLSFEIRRGTIRSDTLEARWYGGDTFLTTSTADITENLDIKNLDKKTIARVHTHQLAIHDTYEVTLMEDINPLIPLVIAHIFRP
ncbi:MAG: hypothetical protein ACP5RS_07085 [Thermoplasmata archaeon]